jgi:HEAT repeat protein
MRAVADGFGVRWIVVDASDAVGKMGTIAIRKEEVDMRLVLGAVLVACVAAAVIVWMRRPKKRGVGFREYVKNPAIRKSMNDAFAARERAIERLKQVPPAKLVARLLDDDWIAPSRAIREVGPAVVPALIAAIGDKRFRVRVDSTGKAPKSALFHRSEPLETVLDCLGAYAPAQAVPHVAPLVRDPNKRVRKAAALLLGEIGVDACVEPLAVCCKDEDDYVRSYAMMGVLRALEAGRVTEGFRAGMYQAIVPLLSIRDSTVSGDAPRCLLGLDRAAAIELMTRAENFRPGVVGLRYVLTAFREKHVRVEESQLLSLAEALEPKAQEYPEDYQLSEVVRLIAREDSPVATAMLRRMATSPSMRVREAALQGMAERLGIVEPLPVVWRAIDAHGWERITPAQRHVAAVRDFVDQVNNGGVSQYFVNSYGAQWRYAEEGLRAMGSDVWLSVLRRAVEKFGPDGPSTDHDVRHEQLAKLETEEEDVFGELTSELYADKRAIDELLWQYILKHPSDFKATGLVDQSERDTP